MWEVALLCVFWYKLFMQMKCKKCGENFSWDTEDQRHFEKHNVMSTDNCQTCLHMQRLAFRNERAFYRRECDATGENILSLYHPDVSYKVYKQEFYWGDNWDARDYGREFDFSRSFFEQLKELNEEVPKLSILNIKPENSEYCNSCVGNKDSYLIIGGDYNEDCMFGILCMKNRSSVDIDYTYCCELCYFSADVENGYNSHYLFNSSNCSDCYFSEKLSGCSECILCFNLNNKKYCILNKQYSEEEYFKGKEELINGKWSSYLSLFERFKELRKDQIVKYAHIVNSENCTGDYIVNSKNCTKCFDVSRSEDCRDIIFTAGAKDCFCCDLVGHNSELEYNCISTASVNNSKYVFAVSDSSDLLYCMNCFNSSSLFGCVDMNHVNYCILNKQYSKEEYEEMVPRIIEHMKSTGEWGQFLDPQISCFGYNETTANLYFPLSREEALKRGFKWRDKDEKAVIPQEYDIADDISEVGEEILNEVLVCESCNKNYKIIKEEYIWYKKQDVPIPRWCMECRMQKRGALRNPRKLFDRQCVKCGEKVATTYSPERPERVYCEQCYLGEIY